MRTDGRRRLAGALAVLGWLAATAPAGAETLDALARQTHYHGIAFTRAGTAKLILATHHGIFALDAEGVATRASAVQDFMGFSPDPSAPGGYFASGHPASGGNSGFLHSADGGATWTRISEGVGGPVDFHQMAVSAADPKTIYGAYGAIQVSRDGGLSWEKSGPPPEGLVALAASPAHAERLYAATQAGLMASDDAGRSWSKAGFDGETVSAVAIGADGAIYAFVPGRGLMRANESAPAEWTGLANGFGDSIPLHLAIDPKDAAHLALTTHKNEVLESIDGGVAWRAFGTR